MRKTTRYSVIINILILIGVALFLTLWNMIPANGVAIISLAIVSIVSALSLIGIILSIGELYKAKDMKYRKIGRAHV